MDCTSHTGAIAQVNGGPHGPSESYSTGQWWTVRSIEIFIPANMDLTVHMEAVFQKLERNIETNGVCQESNVSKLPYLHLAVFLQAKELPQNSVLVLNKRKDLKFVAMKRLMI